MKTKFEYLVLLSTSSSVILKSNSLLTSQFFSGRICYCKDHSFPNFVQFLERKTSWKKKIKRLPLEEEVGKNHYKPIKFIGIDRKSTENCLAHRAHVSSKPRDFRGTAKPHAVSRKIEDLLSNLKCLCIHFLIQKSSPCQHLVQLISDFHYPEVDFKLRKYPIS